MKLVLFSMATAIALFSVGCSGRSVNIQVSDGDAPAKNSNVAVAAPTNSQAPASQVPATQAAVEPPAQAVPVRQPAPVRQAAPAAPVRSAPAPMDASNGQRYFVQTQDGDALNLRASNSGNAAVIGSLPYGTEVIMHLSDRNGEWAEVSAPGNKRGWVAMRFLSTEAAPAPEERAQTANPVGNSAMWVKTLDGDHVNIRSGPSLSDPVIGSLNNGAKVFPIGTVGQWTEIDTGNGVGYVASEYLVQ